MISVLSTLASWRRLYVFPFLSRLRSGNGFFVTSSPVLSRASAERDCGRDWRLEWPRQTAQLVVGVGQICCSLRCFFLSLAAPAPDLLV